MAQSVTGHDLEFGVGRIRREDELAQAVGTGLSLGVLPVDAECQVALGGSAIRVRGQQVQYILQAGLEVPALWYGFDKNALLCHGDAHADLLGVGRVVDYGYL